MLFVTQEFPSLMKTAFVQKKKKSTVSLNPHVHFKEKVPFSQPELLPILKVCLMGFFLSRLGITEIILFKPRLSKFYIVYRIDNLLGNAVNRLNSGGHHPDVTYLITFSLNFGFLIPTPSLLCLTVLFKLLCSEEKKTHAFIITNSYI